MKSNTFALGLIWTALVALLWEAVAWLLVVPLADPMAGSKLPYLHDVLATLIFNGGPLWEASRVTFAQASLGFGLGALVGYSLAVLMSLSRIVERIAYPYLIVSQMIPVLGLAPIIFNLVRNQDLSRVLIAAYITFFPVAANTLSGFRGVDPEKKQLLASYATSLGSSYVKLLVPFSLPHLFSGLKIAAPLSVTASILVDMLGSKDGIGVKLLYSLYGGAMDQFWASVLISAFMGLASAAVISVAERLFLPWDAAQRRQQGGLA